LNTLNDGSRLRQQLARQCRQTLAERSRVVRRGAPRAVHDLRVATRRLEELIEFLQPMLPARPRKRLIRRSRRVRRSLGQIRNVDVMRDLVERYARRLPKARRRSLKPLIERLSSQAIALRQAGGGGHGLKLPSLRKRIVAVRARWRRPDKFSTIRRGREILATRIQELKAALPTARSGGPEALHSLRIVIKRYRYSIEILQQAGLRQARPWLRAARMLQTELGRLHDLDILIVLVRDEAGWAVARALLPELREERRERLQQVTGVIERFDPTVALEMIDTLLAKEAAA
jgi:CHAD domain-containing protein